MTVFRDGECPKCGHQTYGTPLHCPKCGWQESEESRKEFDMVLEKAIKEMRGN